jgi:alpha-amylase
MSSHSPVAPVLRVVVLFAVISLVGGACGSPSLSPSTVASPPRAATPPSASADAALPPTCPPASGTTPPGSATAWWRDRTFYEVFVRSFADSNGDGIGDLRGLTQKLDYLNDGDPATTTDLGVTGLWLMPVAESPSYHGYDVTDYEAIEKDYGTAADFKALMTAAHARGIDVIVDLVLNHTSIDHPWFQDALAGGIHHDWYVWSPTDPSWPNPIGGGDPWHSADGGYYYGVFGEGMPDLNLRTPEVTAEIQRIAAFWLNEMGVDGFRLDAAKHLIEDGPDAQANTPETHAWLAGFRGSVHTHKPAALVLGEVADGRFVSSGYATDGSLDMAFDFEIGPSTATAVQIGDAASLLSNESDIATSYPAGGAATFLSNHDQPRIMTQLHGDASAAKEAAAVLFTAPGVPFVYFGEELGQLGNKPDEQIRTPLPWTSSGPAFGFTTGTPWEPFADGAAAANVATEAPDPTSVLATYRDLIHLRAQYPALAVGSFTPVGASSRKVAASVRVDGAEQLLVVQNLSADAVDGVRLNLKSGPLCGTPAADVVYASASVPPSGAPPVVSPHGGFSNYVPIDELQARSTVVIRLSP